MKDLLDKITSYDLFTNLFPGILCAYFLDTFTNYTVLQKDLVIGVFLYYFLGVVINRIGSNIIEPLLMKIGFIKNADYHYFINASQKDLKIEVLNEKNAMYRTLLTVFVVLLFASLFQEVSESLKLTEKQSYYGLIAGMILLFAFSYRKQTNYITKRVTSSGVHKEE